MSHKPSSAVFRAVVAAGALAAVGGMTQPAYAQTEDTAGGESIDIELVRPSFGHESFTAVDVPRLTKQDVAFRAGVLLQYQQSPLTLYDAATNEELGSVVANRFAATVGASIDVSRVTFGVVIPTALNFGSTETPQYEADGFGLGDIGLSGRVSWLTTRNDVFNLGTRAGIVLPTGLKNSYIGDERIRFSVGQLVAIQAGPVTLATDIGLFTRSQAIETDEDFIASTDVTWNSAVRLALPDATRIALNAQVLTRAGFQRFLTGPAENGLELLGGIEFFPARTTVFGLSAGRGLTAGVGTTDFRLLGNLLIQAPPRREKIVFDPEPPPPPPPIERDPDTEIKVLVDKPTIIETEEGKRIEIPKQPKFRKDTNIILEDSRGIVEEVAALINREPTVAFVKIVGHASQEGDFEYNYRLAESRARAITEALMEQGVAKQRLGYAGEGEVSPKCGDFDQSDAPEDVLECNRRVEFIVEREFGLGDQLPGVCEGDQVKDCYPAQQRLPWNGSLVDVVIPAAQSATPEEDDNTDEFGTIDFDTDLDDEEE